jgi:sulfur relay protein TusB/DsrH
MKIEFHKVIYMHVGFILTKTPSEEGFNTFLKFLKIYLGKTDISIYLIGNGVYCLRSGHYVSEIITRILNDTNNAINLYVCGDDLKARGLTVEVFVNNVKQFINYDELVIDIMENIDQILSF